MPAPPAPARALTTKQAKAAYKARSGTSLSEREKKQLQRSIELDRRAWRAQEAEKRRAEAAKKRVEKERKEKEDRIKARMGSQRRCDKFGYMSSQMHLGAFMKKPTGASGKEYLDRKDGVDVEFGDDEVDDETLLGMLDGSIDKPEATNPMKPQAQQKTNEALTLCKERQELVRPNPVPCDHAIAISDELDSFWNQLGSSTQIARELSTVEPKKEFSHSTSTSFSSDEFDFTVEDLAELESPASTITKAKQDRALMPPPPLPKKPATAEPVLQKPTVSTRQSVASLDSPALDFGFTMSQLAEVAAEDIQLTQDDPT